MYYIIYLQICYIRNSYIPFTKMLFDFWHIYKSDCSDILEFLICLNRKTLLVFGIFTNQTVLIYYIRISDMLESKNSTRFWNIYKSDCSDILYYNFSCKTRCIIKKIRIEENFTTVVEPWVSGISSNGKG